MFILISVLALTNICIIPYYFTSQFEYFIIECLIPFLNNIYISKNQQRIIEVKIYTKLETDPINIDILHNDEMNKNINETNSETVDNNNKTITDNNKTITDNNETVIDNNKTDIGNNNSCDDSDEELDDEYYLIF
jgi:hypothetical protein